MCGIEKIKFIIDKYRKSIFFSPNAFIIYEVGIRGLRLKQVNNHLKMYLFCLSADKVTVRENSLGDISHLVF